MVPPVLPDVLKQWTKAVIRKNPDDVLAFSASYFGRLAGAEGGEGAVGDVLPSDSDDDEE